MKKLRDGARQCRYTMFHPVNGFDQVKWNDAGSMSFCIVILLAFYLVRVFDQVLMGFIFDKTNPDRVSVISVFLLSIGGFVICYVANWAVSSLMFTEGKARQVFIMLCYTLVPYTVCELLYVIVTNVANQEMQAFMTAIRVVGLLWSGVILIVGEYYVHQLSAGKVVLNLALTAVGVMVLLFLVILGYSLVQQIYAFLYTIYSEIAFRL